MIDNFGYGEVDKVIKENSGSDKYLNFKKGDKDRIIQIRLASEPRYINQHWITDNKGKQMPVNCEGETCAYCGKDIQPKDKMQKTAKWAWTVIDREDSLVKVFTGPTLIARSIKEISELTNKVTKKLMWGDPRTFDIQIERTEEPGKAYYKVNPVVDGKGELTEEEKKKVLEAGYDLVEELKGGKKSDRTGAYSMETAPSEEKTDIPANLGEESTMTENINPDDLPF